MDFFLVTLLLMSFKCWKNALLIWRFFNREASFAMRSSTRNVRVVLLTARIFSSISMNSDFSCPVPFFLIGFATLFRHSLRCFGATYWKCSNTTSGCLWALACHCILLRCPGMQLCGRKTVSATLKTFLCIITSTPVAWRTWLEFFTVWAVKEHTQSSGTENYLWYSERKIL